MSEHNDFNLDSSLFSPQPEKESSQQQGLFLLDESAGFTTDSKGAANGDVADERYDSTRLRSESMQERVARVKAAPIPLLEAAQPLLRALSEMPSQMPGKSQAQLFKESLKREITLFSVVCDETDIPWKKMAIVRYCLCTALDEAAHALPWGRQVGWSQSNLLNHFEGDNDGGDKFFLLVGRLSMSYQEYADVLEVLLVILGLGFEGRYSIIENGDRQLNKIRQRLLVLLQSSRESWGAALAPNAVPHHKVRQRRFYVPVRVSLLLAGLILSGTFIWTKYHLLVPLHQITDRIDAASRLAVVQPAPVVAKLRLAELLKVEIAKQLVSVDENDERSLVTFRGDGMFLTGTTQVQESMQAILQRVADEIHRVNGRVVITGFTDSQPIHKRDIPNNQVLSEKRADSVAQFLEQAGIPADHIRSVGAGDTQPIASNATAEGRAQNRRVELLVNY